MEKREGRKGEREMYVCIIRERGRERLRMNERVRK